MRQYDWISFLYVVIIIIHSMWVGKATPKTTLTFEWPPDETYFEFGGGVPWVGFTLYRASTRVLKTFRTSSDRYQRNLTLPHFSVKTSLWILHFRPRIYKVWGRLPYYLRLLMNEIDFNGKLSSFMKINTISHLIYDLTKAKHLIKYSFSWTNLE